MTNKRFTETRLYRILRGMKQRCYNTHCKEYSRYGGRGIKICDEWIDKKNGAKNFHDWAKKSGYKCFLTIDRINNNGDYCPENCRWATRKQQANNKRNTIMIEYNGKTKPISYWCRIYKLHRLVVYRRLKSGITGYKLFVPAGITKLKEKDLDGYIFT